MGYKPSEFAALPLKEKAFLIACIDNKTKAENEELNRLKR